MGNGRQVTSVLQLQVPALRYRRRYLSGACNEGVGVLPEAHDEAGDRDLGQSGQPVLVAGDEVGRPLPRLGARGPPGRPFPRSVGEVAHGVVPQSLSGKARQEEQGQAYWLQWLLSAVKGGPCLLQETLKAVSCKGSPPMRTESWPPTLWAWVTSTT